jgi:hypothetical protein
MGYIYNVGTSASSGGLYIRTDGSGNLLTLNSSGTDIVTISPPTPLSTSPPISLLPAMSLLPKT